jgi:hypothetical protein
MQSIAHAEAARGSFSSLWDRVLSHDESVKHVVVDAGVIRQTDARDTGHGAVIEDWFVDAGATVRPTFGIDDRQCCRTARRRRRYSRRCTAPRETRAGDQIYFADSR